MRLSVLSVPEILIILVITEPEATNSFNINFQVFRNNNKHNHIKIDFVGFVAVLKKAKCYSHSFYFRTILRDMKN